MVVKLAAAGGGGAVAAISAEFAGRKSLRLH